MLKTDIVLPSFEMARNDNDEPRRVVKHIDTLLPKRHTLRILTVEPIWKLSSTESGVNLFPCCIRE
jgi:hypothetical protein